MITDNHENAASVTVVAVSYRTLRCTEHGCRTLGVCFYAMPMRVDDQGVTRCFATHRDARDWRATKLMRCAVVSESKRQIWSLSAHTSSALRRWSNTALPADTPMATAIYTHMKKGDGCLPDPGFRIV
jgi:hypothetical protein